MQQLPRGYYAVASDFENASKDTFTYKGVTYAVTEGVNLFATVHDADKAAKEIPEMVLDGVNYTEFSAPVILFSVGKHKIDRYRFGGSRYLLGENAGVSPNVWSEDRFASPAFNEARTEDKDSVLWGSYYGGVFVAEKATCEIVVVDGFTLADARFLTRLSQILQGLIFISTPPSFFPRSAGINLRGFFPVTVKTEFSSPPTVPGEI